MDAPKSFCKAQFIEAARAAQWNKLRKKKRAIDGDMQGLAEIHFIATQALLKGQEAKKRPLDDEGKRHLQKAVSGAFRPASRLYKAKILRSPI